MPGAAGTLERIAAELATALAPLEQHLQSEGAQAFIARLGLRLPPPLDSDPQLLSAVSTVATSASGLGPLIVKLTDAITADDEAGIIAAGLALLEKIAELLAAVVQIGSSLNAIAGSGGLTPGQVAQLQAFADKLARKLLDWLVIEYLSGKAKGVVPTLAVVGLVDDEEQPGDPSDPLSPPYRKRELHLDRVVNIFVKPEQYLKDAFDFGNPTFDGSKFFPKVKALLDDVDLPATLLAATGQPLILEALFFRLSVDNTHTPPDPPSLTFRFRIPATQDFSRTFPLGKSIWNLVLDAKARFEAGIDGAVKPPLNASLQPPTGSITIDLQGGLAAQRAGGTVVIFAEGGGTKLEVGRVAFTGGFSATLDSSGQAHGEPSVSGEVVSAKLTIDLSQGDGFIASLLSGVKIAANLEFKLHWSPSTGFQIEGSSAIEIALPTHVSLGPIEIQRLYLKLGLASDGSVPAELSSGFKANLGPLEASIDRIGISAKTTFPSNGGNLGPLNVALAFKPPSGVGLAVNAGVVKGGGFLYIDPDKGEYAGALELMVADFLSLHAIGLINTKMPDGSTGFSLLIIITAEFASGIQLGFGFTLLAVGGLLGLNRTMLFQPIMDGVRSGAINSIMFPHDVVANAPRIISDLKAIFPPHEGTFLIGPMAKLGWGTPTLVSLSLGVIIEIPPGDIAILGVLQLALPDPDDILILIQVNFAGALEFSKKRLYFFASMYDSRVLFITIDGEMGVLVAYGDDANFLVLVGGCHPQYKPPPLPFPNPKRIQISILNESYARIRCDAYFAVTTNTVQFGSHAELFFGFDSVSIKGHLGFDALVQFSPFHFIVTLSGGVALTVFGMGLFGIDIDLLLEGPTPWHAHGTASISFLFFSIGVTVDFSWGDDRQTTLPPVVVMPLLTAELQKDANWRAVLPSGSNLLVTLRKLDPAESDFVLHPVGTLHVSQRYIPLDLTLDKIGNQKPSDANRFSLAVSPNGLTKRSDLMESFAPAQFQNFGDAQKLSQAAFQPQHGGIELSASADLKSGTAITRIVRYNLTVVDTKYRQYAQKFFVLVGALFDHFLKGASVSRNALSAYRQSQVQPFTDRVTVAPETFAVAFQSNNTVYHPAAASFSSQAAAADYLDREVARDRTLQGTLHVLPQFEVAA